MKLRIRVHYLDDNRIKRKSFFLPRVVRILPNNIGVGIKHKDYVYPLYKTNIIDIHAATDSLFLPFECAILKKNDAIELLKSLKNLASHSNAIDGHQSPLIIENKESNNILSEIPDRVYTKPLITKIMDPYGVAFNFSLALEVLYRPPEALSSFPIYEKDWFIERTDWYVYFLINDNTFEILDPVSKEVQGEDVNRLSSISTILANASEYRLYDSAYLHAHNNFDQKSLQKAKYLDEPLESKAYTPFAKFMLGEPIELSEHETLLDKWGDFEFEERGSTRPANNNRHYDHWYRFDLSWSDNDLAALFHDIFKLQTFDQAYNEGLGNFFTSPPLEALQSQPEVFSSKTFSSVSNNANKKMDQLKSLNKESTILLQGLEEKNDNITLQLWDAQEAIEKLKKRIDIYKDREKHQISRTLNNFLNPEIYIPRRGLKTLETDFRSRDFVYKILNSLIKDESSVNFKDAYTADGWKEVDKKISTGQDDQGRIYVAKIKKQDTKFVVLIGHKKNQSKDFEFMRSNHPSRIIEDK